MTEDADLDTSMIEPRRSTRERKKTAIYQNSNNPYSKNDSEDELDYDDEAAGTKRKQIRLQKARAKRNRPTIRRLKAVKENTNEHSSDEEGDRDSYSTLFEAVRRPNTALDSVTLEFTRRYGQDPHAATVELVNFLLYSCGASECHVPKDEDLGALDINWIVGIVLPDLEASIQDNYPIMSKEKAFKKFKDSFSEFWERLVAHFCQGPIFEEGNMFSRYLEWIISLSSAQVRAVRHTSTLAAYDIASELVDQCAEFDKKADVARRQLSAETKRNKGRVKSQKEKQLQENCEQCSEHKRHLLDLMTLIFSGVFVHRYRDTAIDIRILSIEALGYWIRSHGETFLDDQYLKYLGWMLNDKASKVRAHVLEELIQIYECEGYAESTEMFTSRFVGRYVEMCTDTDLGVAEAAIRLVCIVDKFGLMNEDQDVEQVEQLVFDSMSPEIRRAAAAFVVLQYEAFSPLDSKDMVNRNSHQTMQLVALVEFTESNMDGNLDLVDFLVDAFWELEEYDLVRQWTIMTQLLLTDARKQRLNSLQQTILSRILLTAVKKAVRDADEERTKKHGKHRAKIVEQLSVELVGQIPLLLKRFQADEDKLTLLVELVACLNLENIASNRLNIEDLAHALKETYLNHGDEELMDRTAESIRFLCTSDYAKKRDAEAMRDELLEEVIEKLMHLLKLDFMAFKKKKDSDTNREYSLTSCLHRLYCMYCRMDCRSVVGNVAMDSCIKELESLLERRADVTRFSHHPHESGPAVVQHSLNTLWRDFLWQFQSFFEKAKGLEKDQANDLAVAIEGLSSRRDALIELIRVIMSLQYKQDEQNGDELVEWDLDTTQENFIVMAQGVAYQIFCDLRCLCVPKLRNTAVLKCMAFEPDDHLTLLIQNYFTRKMANKAERTHALLPFARMSSYTPQNKKQAALVLSHLRGSGKACTDIVKVFSKGLKDNAPVRYLEVQMTALQNCFKSRLKEQLEEDDCDDIDHVGRFAQLKELAKALSNTMGIGKVAQSVRAPFYKFLCEGIRFALDAPDNFLFLEAMRPYLVHMDNTNRHELKLYFEELLSRLRDSVQEEITEEAEKSDRERSREAKAVTDFRSSLATSEMATTAVAIPRDDTTSAPHAIFTTSLSPEISPISRPDFKSAHSRSKRGRVANTSPIRDRDSVPSTPPSKGTAISRRSLNTPERGEDNNDTPQPRRRSVAGDKRAMSPVNEVLAAADVKSRKKYRDG